MPCACPHTSRAVPVLDRLRPRAAASAEPFGRTSGCQAREMRGRCAGHGGAGSAAGAEGELSRLGKSSSEPGLR